MIQTEISAENIAILTIDMPETSMNVFNDELLVALDSTVRAVAENADIAGIIIRSGKEHFLAGADIGMFAGYVAPGVDWTESHHLAGRLSVLLRKLERCGKPTACIIHGFCLGGGLELALACHHRIAIDSARTRLGLPEVTIGILPGGGGTQRLPRLIGTAEALPLMLSGEFVDGRRALDLGIVDQLCTVDEALPRAIAWLMSDAASAIAPWDRNDEPADPGRSPADLEAIREAREDCARSPHYPAPQSILRCVEDGVGIAFDDALALELSLFTDLVRGPAAQNMVRTVFVSKQAVDKGQFSPAPHDRQDPLLGMWAEEGGPLAQLLDRTRPKSIAREDATCWLEMLDGSRIRIRPADDRKIAPVDIRLSAGFGGGVMEILARDESRQVELIAAAYALVRMMRGTPVRVYQEGGYVGPIEADLSAFYDRLRSEGFDERRINQAKRHIGMIRSAADGGPDNDTATLGQRILHVQFAAAWRLWEVGAIRTAIEADVAAVFGWDFPRHLGGPFSYVDCVGAACALELFERWRDGPDGRGTEPGFLRTMVRSGERFYPSGN